LQGVSIEIEKRCETVHVEEIQVVLTRAGGDQLGVRLGSTDFDEHTVVCVDGGSAAEGKIFANDIIEEVNEASTKRESVLNSTMHWRPRRAAGSHIRMDVSIQILG
jgi:C-terminal processing protease CtpA/Prc